MSAVDPVATSRYRPGLDGVRAVAVLGVLLYHAGVGAVPGGFLGVDVFFVLSGYLITGLLVDEWQRRGSVDLVRFWGRRARRLLPALFLVLVAVAGYAAWAAPDDQARSIRSDALSSLAYVANWHFVASAQSYFTQFQAPSPLLHTWSLAIEEQFYLVFPLLLLLLLSRTGGRISRVAPAIMVGVAASTVAMALLYAPDVDPSRVYYGTDTRAQALLVGALLAIAAPVLHSNVALRVMAALGCVGLAGLLVVFATVHDDSAVLFRGGFLGVAVLSAALVGAAALDDGPIHRLLSARPLVALGLVSYGVYLWHWPVFVYLTPDRVGLDGIALLVLRLFATGVAAALSFHFVERPVREGALGRLDLRRRTAAITGTVAAVVAVVIAATTAGAPALASAPVGTTQSSVAASSGEASAFLVGDSVPFGLREAFRPEWAPGLAINGSTALGCGLIPEPLVVEGQSRGLKQECVDWAQRWPSELSAANPSVAVVFPGIGELFDHEVAGRVLTFGSSAFESHLDDVLAGYVGSAGSAGRPVVLVNVPCHRVPIDPTEDDGRIINDERRTFWLNSVLDRFAESSAGRVQVLDLHRFLCSDGYVNRKEGVTLRKDGLHFTPGGAKLVWRRPIEQLRAQLRGQLQHETGVAGAAGDSGRATTAFLVGDSVSYGLRSAFVDGSVPGLAVSGSTELSCGLFPDLLVAEGKRIPAEPQCHGWQRRWSREVVEARPDVAVLMVGSWEQYDRIVDGRLLRVGTDDFARYLGGRIESDLQVLSRSAGKVALTTVPCHRTPDLGLGPEPRVVNDDRRVVAVNEIVRSVAAAHPEITVVDLDAALCSSGYTTTREGVTLRKDGLHFTDAGAAVVWRWLGPQLVAIGARG